MTNPPLLRFSFEDLLRAEKAWGANCGPCAIAAIVGLTLDEIRPFLGRFEHRRYTSPPLVAATLDRLGVGWSKAAPHWPRYGLACVRWSGNWKSWKSRQWHSHLVGVFTRTDGAIHIFEPSALSGGGWMPVDGWQQEMIPWHLEKERGADGGWSISDVFEIEALPGALEAR